MVLKKNHCRLWSVVAALVVAIVGTAHEYSASEAKIIRQVPTTHKVVAFTFDDGPHPGTTPELLAVLREKGVKATFFILGRNGALCADLLRQVASDGHELGNHGYSHKFSRQLSMEAYLADVEQNEALLGTVGARPVLFRPPGGGYNDALVARLKQKGYTTVLWSVDTRDWSRTTVDQVVKTAIHNLKPGAIYLFHDGQNDLPTPKAVSILIDNFHAQGYEIVPVGELLQYYEIRH